MNTQTSAPGAITVLAYMESYITKLQDHSDRDFQVNYPNTWNNGGAPKFEFTEGKRFFKVIKADPASRAVFCFVERTSGDIYKAATWNTQAKGARGNIFNDKLPLTLGSLYK